MRNLLAAVSETPTKIFFKHHFPHCFKQYWKMFSLLSFRKKIVQQSAIFYSWIFNILGLQFSKSNIYLLFNSLDFVTEKLEIIKK